MRILTVLVTLVVAAAAADAQVIIQYEKKGKNYTFSFEYNSGYGAYSYGSAAYGYYGGGASYGTGGYGTYYGSPGATYYGAGTYGPSYYGSGPAGGYPRYAPDTSPPVSHLPKYHGAPDPGKITQLTVAKEVEDGIKLVKQGRIREGLDKFKEAFLRDTGHPVPQVYMALALAALGEYRKADSAFVSALTVLTDVPALRKIKIAELFREKDYKEFREGLAARTSGDGVLAAGIVSFMLDEKDDARKRLKAVKGETLEPIAKKLSEHLSQ